jgi:hypothetical protein
LAAPTPGTSANAARLAGRSSAISRKVESWKITYGGTAAAAANSRRFARSASNSGLPASSPRTRALRPLRRAGSTISSFWSPLRIGLAPGPKERPPKSSARSASRAIRARLTGRTSAISSSLAMPNTLKR